jgi:hypothetical protein
MGWDKTNIPPPAPSPQSRQKLADLGEARDHLRTIAYAAAEGADSVNPEVVILACLAIARRASEVGL